MFTVAITVLSGVNNSISLAKPPGPWSTSMASTTNR
jgi:hypothetical protein